MTIKKLGSLLRLLAVLLLFTVITLAALACGGSASGQADDPGGTEPADTNGPNLQGTITISGAFALYPLVIKWSEEFQKAHPDVRFDITAGGAGKGMTDVLSGLADIAMFSREPSENELERGAVLVPVAIDAVVPTANADNPFREEIQAKGLSRQELADIYINGSVTDWKQLFPEAQGSDNTAIQVYTRSDASGAADVWAEYFDGEAQEDLRGIGVNGDPGVAEAVRQDRLGIGYNNVGFAYDAGTREPLAGLLVIPIDLNENGVIDPEEDFYTHRDGVTQAIADGAYPSPPARELTLVAKGQFTGVAQEFLRWALTDGQAFVSEAGYAQVSKEKINSGLEKLR
jgi:phosphate transport system substrate-binding protein